MRRCAALYFGSGSTAFRSAYFIMLSLEAKTEYYFGEVWACSVLSSGLEFSRSVTLRSACILLFLSVRASNWFFFFLLVVMSISLFSSSPSLRFHSVPFFPASLGMVSLCYSSYYRVGGAAIDLNYHFNRFRPLLHPDVHYKEQFCNI